MKNDRNIAAENLTSNDVKILNKARWKPHNEAEARANAGLRAMAATGKVHIPNDREWKRDMDKLSEALDNMPQAT